MMRYFLLVTLALSFLACNNNREEEILMSTVWTYDAEATRAILSAEPASEGVYNFMEGLMSQLQTATMEFKPDHVLVVNIGGEVIEGHWEVKKGWMLMQLTKLASPPYKVLEMTNERIVIRPEGEDPYIFTRVLVPVK